MRRHSRALFADILFMLFASIPRSPEVVSEDVTGSVEGRGTICGNTTLSVAVVRSSRFAVKETSNPTLVRAPAEGVDPESGKDSLMTAVRSGS